MRSELLTRTLQAMANTAYFARGQAYHDQDRVQWLDEEGGRIHARVSGTRDYTVQLWEEEGKLGYRCDCPIGQEGAFCKHGVATALAWLKEIKAQSMPTGTTPPKRRSAIEDIRDYLAGLAPTVLIDLIINTCLRDDRLREKLLLAARGRSEIHIAIKSWKEALRRATATRGFVDYSEMPYFATRIREVVNVLDDWISDNRAEFAIDLAEYAVDRIEAIIEQCDDSNGEMGDLLNYLAQLHLKACQMARPDPKALAERLFEYELQGEWGTFTSTPIVYAEVLGEIGLAHYRQLAEAEWAKVPTLEPESVQGQSWEGGRYRITAIMEALMRQTGDIEALVAIYRRDLSSAWRFLQVAEIYQQAGQADQALDWAERGLKAFPERTDWRLREFLIEAYLQRERREEALALVWAQYAERPELSSFNYLKLTVQRAGADWAEWRARALTYLRQQIAREVAKQKKAGYVQPPVFDQSVLVQILLSEQDIETAWREAKAGGCRAELWLQLADLRKQVHPEEALEVYQRQAAQWVEQTNTPAYEQAIVLIRKSRPLLQAQEDGDQRWSQYLLALRSKYKLKRNFIKLMNMLQ